MVAEYALRAHKRVTCPHCLCRFPSANTLWISKTEGEDPLLGANQFKRFLPRRFTIDWQALDEEANPCSRLACPECHLELPRSIFNMQCSYWSMIGPPSTGKSYVLACMTHRLADLMTSHFALSFTAADVLFNSPLTETSDRLFNEQRTVRIEKTQPGGDKRTTNTVRRNDRNVIYARPFVFEVKPSPRHFNADRGEALNRLLCWYDNAGEDFNPDRADTIENQAAAHLTKSQVLMYLFDPTQDAKFRKACESVSKDPQVCDPRFVKTTNQANILVESKNRINNVGEANRKRPLFILVTKYDIWKGLLDVELSRNPWQRVDGNTYCELDLEYIEEISRRVKQLVWKHSPRVIGIAEEISDHVCFLPVSATGRAPVADERLGLAFPSGEISPIWVEIPVLYALCRWYPGLIRRKLRESER